MIGGFNGLLQRLTHFRRFSRLADQLSYHLFYGATDTPPISVDPNATPLVYSLLAHRHVTAYLLAIKSLWRFLDDAPCSVVVQSDGSLTPTDCDLLKRHVRGIEIRHKSDCDAVLGSVLPTSVRRWLPSAEKTCFLLPLKLLHVLYAYPGRYVILLDSDVLFLRPPIEAVKCLREGNRRTFHSPGGSLLTKSFHEIGFDFQSIDVSDFNSGFTGFWNHFSDETIASTLRRVHEHDPGLFAAWEIEQALWCVLLSSSENPLNLGKLAPGYVGNGWRSHNELQTQSVLVHFVGSTRFRDLSYLRLGRQVMRELRAITGVPRNCASAGTKN